MSGKKTGGESVATGVDQPQVSVGIDLGTTYSCVAVWKNGRVEIIPNDQGNRITPSCVAFTDRQRFVGDSAFNQIATNPANTIFDAKRLIGRTYGDWEVQSDMKLWPFRVVEGDQGKPMIAVRYKGEEKRFAAEEISSMVLGKMKQCAEAYLDASVRNAVITVPAYFNDSQRQATKDAGTIAGLDVMRIINEPTAAAIAYGLDGKESGRTGRRNVLIFDLGGGTFDVSILEVEDGILEVKATAGDTHLGGEDFDQRLVEFFAKDFRRRNGADISGNPKALRRLRTACERAKRSLQHSAQATVEVDSLHEGIDYYCTLSRAKFEELNMDLFLKCMETVKHCLRDARMDKSTIDDLVLVGGSTRILKVQELLRELFDGKQLSNSVNPDEAVAFGAAVQAAMLEETVVDLVLRDVAPLSLGIETHGGIMSVVIPRNTPAPTVMEKVFTTTHDWQTEAGLAVYEGERHFIRDNKRLGTFNIAGLASAHAGVTKFTVRFALDDNGILHASAAEHGTRNKAETVITNERGALSAADIKRMVRDAEKYREEDEEMARKVQARNELERFVYSVKGSASRAEVAGRMSAVERDTVVEAVARCFEWLGENELPEARECERMRTALERAWTPVVTKLMRERT